MTFRSYTHFLPVQSHVCRGDAIEELAIVVYRSLCPFYPVYRAMSITHNVNEQRQAFARVYSVIDGKVEVGWRYVHPPWLDKPTVDIVYSRCGLLRIWQGCFPASVLCSLKSCWTFPMLLVQRSVTSLRTRLHYSHYTLSVHDFLLFFFYSPLYLLYFYPVSTSAQASLSGVL